MGRFVTGIAAFIPMLTGAFRDTQSTMPGLPTAGPQLFAAGILGAFLRNFAPPPALTKPAPSLANRASLQSRRQGQGQAGRDGGDLRPALKNVRKVQFQRQRIIEFLGGDRQDPRQIRGCRQGSIGLADRGRVRVDRTAAT